MIVPVLWVLAAPFLVLAWLMKPILLIAGGINVIGHILVARRLGWRRTLHLGWGPTLGESVGAAARRVSVLPGIFLEPLQEDFEGATAAQRALYLAAGPLANVVAMLALPAMIFSVPWMLGTLQRDPNWERVSPPACVGSVRPASPAEEAALSRGDCVIGVNGQPTPNWDALVATIAASAREGEAQELTLEIEREGARRFVTVLPELLEGRPLVGITLHHDPAYDPKLVLVRLSPPAALAKGAAQTRTVIEEALDTLVVAWAGEAESQTVTGPVSQFDIAAKAVEHSSVGFWAQVAATALAYSNLMLLLYNLLPLPFSDTFTALNLVLHHHTHRQLPEKPYARLVLGAVGALILWKTALLILLLLRI